MSGSTQSSDPSPGSGAGNRVRALRPVALQSISASPSGDGDLTQKSGLAPLRVVARAGLQRFILELRPTGAAHETPVPAKKAPSGPRRASSVWARFLDPVRIPCEKRSALSLRRSVRFRDPGSGSGLLRRVYPRIVRPRGKGEGLSLVRVLKNPLAILRDWRISSPVTGSVDPRLSSAFS